MSLDSAEKELLNKLSLRKLAIPILLGLLAASYLLWSNLQEVTFQPSDSGNYVWTDANGDKVIDKSEPEEFLEVPAGTGDFIRIANKEVLSAIDFTWYSGVWLLIALLCVVARDLGYIIRIRILTHGQLSWRQAFDSIMLWEFSSAMTPSVVGGSGIAIFILNREGISLGKSTATVFVTAMLDELFYILSVPLVIFLIGMNGLFPVELQKEIFGITFSTKGIFWVGYGFIVAMTVGIILSIFLFPHLFRNLLIRTFSISFLRKWRYKAGRTGDDLVTTSNELGKQPFSYWAKSFAATIFSWSARFWVVNFLILAINPVSEHFLIYGRQLVMWVIMLISPTPGSSGVAEVAFSGFLKDFITPGMIGAIALIWRLFTYYPYLFAGALVLPGWLKRTAQQKQQGNT